MLKFPFKRANETVMSQKDLFVFFKSIEMFSKSLSMLFFLFNKTACHAQKEAKFNETEKMSKY